ncbi:NUDIX hydrolase [uncultured Eubacterium sp.]|uniref:NUDIX hydrolase N-terminal domain-containing protein n=1 Tax=uncultured Eubacterium sp. TaxID=165185 RepID=UPI0026734FFA|nr:NUDIX hydrolase [uncultured Eubacterium sp.]
MDKKEKWLEWAMEIQSIAQAGLTYGHDEFDKERYERLREISAEILAYKTDMTVEKVKDLFCNETGYQTPKVDTRAAVFENGKILLVHEKDGRWSLPGGWCDVDQSVAENTVKETVEEAGLEVKPTKLIGVQDRNKHNTPVYAYGVVKIFVMCTLIGGSFVENIETTETKYFARNEIPENLANEKVTREQIEMCFDAYNDEHWMTQFD